MKLQNRVALAFQGRAGWTHLVVALTLSVAAFTTTPAAATEIEWAWQQVFWDSAGGVAQIHLGDEADTIRTRLINTETWAWDAFDVVNTVKAIPVIFVAQGIVSVADTIYYRAEIGAGGKVTFGTRFEAPTAFNCATSTGGGVASATAINGVYWGFLEVDGDTRDGHNIFAAKQFRLLVYGDQAGTAPILTGLECYIRYPKRASAY